MILAERDPVLRIPNPVPTMAGSPLCGQFETHATKMHTFMAVRADRALMYSVLGSFSRPAAHLHTWRGPAIVIRHMARAHKAALMTAHVPQGRERAVQRERSQVNGSPITCRTRMRRALGCSERTT